MGSWDDTDEESTPQRVTRSQAIRVNESKITDLTHRLAALAVRRMSNQHACMQSKSGECSDIQHREDADFLREMLECLELPSEYPQVSDQDRAEWLHGLKAVNRSITMDDLE